MVRPTGEAPVISLLRYGNASTGSGLAGQAMGTVDANIINVLARLVLGMNRSARLPFPNVMSALMSSTAQQCRIWPYS